MRGVYHGGRRGHECADSADVAQHENRERSARILEARKRLKIMRTEWSAAHGFREWRDGRGAGVSPAMRLRLFRGARGERAMSGRLRRRRHGSQSTGMAEREPRSREAVRLVARRFTRDDSPGEDECRGDGARDSLFG
jgi:hypothetical protein